MVFISFECDNIPPTWGKPVSTGWPGAQLIDNALSVTHLPLFKIIPSINLSISFLKQFVKVNGQFVKFLILRLGILTVTLLAF